MTLSGIGYIRKLIPLLAALLFSQFEDVWAQNPLEGLSIQGPQNASCQWEPLGYALSVHSHPEDRGLKVVRCMKLTGIDFQRDQFLIDFQGTELQIRTSVSEAAVRRAILLIRDRDESGSFCPELIQGDRPQRPLLDYGHLIGSVTRICDSSSNYNCMNQSQMNRTENLGIRIAIDASDVTELGGFDRVDAIREPLMNFHGATGPGIHDFLLTSFARLDSIRQRVPENAWDLYRARSVCQPTDPVAWRRNQRAQRDAARQPPVTEIGPYQAPITPVDGPTAPTTRIRP